MRWRSRLPVLVALPGNFKLNLKVTIQIRHGIMALAVTGNLPVPVRRATGMSDSELTCRTVTVPR